jgi:catechol 2,3-dioxygenase-like lactoylglutathione lyase family enzyme
MIRCIATLATIVAALGSSHDAQHTPTVKSEPMAPALRNTCLITKDVRRMTDFYARTLRYPAKTSGKDYSEFGGGGTAALAIFSADAQEKYIPGSAQAASNKSAILEFEVTDVDMEYARLQSIVKIWVKPPTTQPWGTRSIYFRDPDGNLVDFYAWVKAH